jgi:dihydroorotate dehydrogenase (NAD+) catalytic subunit
VTLPVVGLGGVSKGTDVVQYIVAGASLVGVGTAALRDPRAPARIVSELETWCRKHGVHNIQELTGTLEWPT